MDNRESAKALILRHAADSGRCVLIEVTNNSELSLENKRYYCKSGEILHHGLETIEPGAKDCTLFGKKSFMACGSVGVLTFQLNDRQSQRLAILFSNPFNRIIYDRAFGLHFTKTGASARQLYEDMYSHGERLENYIKARTDSVIQFPHKLVHNGVQVTATMSAESKAILRVVIEDFNEDRPTAGKDNSGNTNPRAGPALALVAPGATIIFGTPTPMTSSTDFLSITGQKCSSSLQP
ncbi:uncharacterized protein LOC144752965 isoform X1 [Lissotriton helveticus]